MAITTRAVKGSELTWAELDANFNELNTAAGNGTGSALSVTIPGGAISVTLIGSSTFSVVGTRTATVTGGTAPYTYIWSKEGVLAGSLVQYEPRIVLTNATSATVTASATGSGYSISTTLRCLVIDAKGKAAFATLPLTVAFEGNT